MSKLVNHMFKDMSIDDKEAVFTGFGRDIFSSEQLTDHVYSTFVSMITKGWEGSAGQSRREFSCSDIGLIYGIGPYIPCVERVSFTNQIDIRNDGLPGIRVFGGLNKNSYDVVGCVRPVNRFPNDIQPIGRCLKKYKYTVLYPVDNKDYMRALTLWFGINEKGNIVSTFNKRIEQAAFWHGASQVYPSIAINAWADSKYLWLAKTSENVGLSHDLKLRLGLDKEHIKSLFYARSIPVTDTGRKRPILHWVKAHQRRIKSGIDIDINPYLRGITEFEMDGLRFQITQPNKEELHKAEPETVNEAFKLYA